MKCLLLVVMSSVLVACGGGGSSTEDHEFTNVSESSVGSSDLVVKNEDIPEVLIKKASHSGKGCPSGAGELTYTPDKKTLSVLFEDFLAEAGAGTESDSGSVVTKKRVACSVAITLDVPDGYQAFLIGADFRGAVVLPMGANAEFNREYFFASAKSPILTATWSDETDVDIDISDDLYVDSYGYTPCGEDVILRNNISLYVSAPADADTALIQLDSVDYQKQQDKAQFDYQFNYVECS